MCCHIGKSILTQVTERIYFLMWVSLDLRQSCVMVRSGLVNRKILTAEDAGNAEKEEKYILGCWC